MNVQEDETPSGRPPQDHERDVLAERRARRGEPAGDPILIRRAETAEAAAQALEERLSGIQARLREAEQEAEAASQRLAERERELGSASQRLSEGERQLQAISDRLADRERELQDVSRRLSDRDDELRTLSERLAEREQQLHRAELEIRGRVEALELRVSEVQDDLAQERAAREAAERELGALRAAQGAVQPLVGELKQIAHRLRLAAEATPPAGSVVPGPPAVRPAGDEQPPGGEEPSGSQMAEALAAAVQRLRARVATVGDRQDEEPSESPGAGTEAEATPTPTPYVPAPVAETPPPCPWLAPAIRRVAQRRDARLAGELVLELLPARPLAVDRDLRYCVRIAELGSYEISRSQGYGSVRELAAGESPEAKQLVLEGPAAAFAEVAAGGSRLSAWRPPPGLRIRGGRRRAKPLLAAWRAPLALADLERAGVTVWPGLLLLALAEAIEPARTASHSFTVAFAIEGPQSAVLHVQALDGRPPAVTRALGEAAPGRESLQPQTPPQTVVHLSERAFARMISGHQLGEETIVLEGDRGPLETLLGWTDEVQGIRRLGA